MAGGGERYGDQPSFWESLFHTLHVFLLGVAAGSFLTYHYICKPTTLPSASSSAETSSHKIPGINLPCELSGGNSGGGGWRDSNPADTLLATPNPEQQHNNRRRRSSLYH